MNTKKIGAATFAVVAAAGLLAGCGNSTEGDSPVAFSPVTGDQFTANPGAFQTDGVAAPPQGVTMVGNAVAAQAVANAGLPQGTITSTVNNTTVYYPPAPAIPGLRPAPQPAPPAPMVRPANYRPWNYTPQQIEVYRQICETGTWNNYRAGIQVQTQTCWTLYGRQLGVKPWQPGQPKPWQRPDYPKPWFDASFKVDVPVFWVYPKDWTKPKPQPLISVSISLNVPNNPYRRVNPRDNVLYYPVWAVTPGRVVDARDQGRILAPVYTETTTTTTTTTKYVYAPTAPGVVLAPLPTSNKVELVTALPGAKVTGNVNVDAKVLVPTAAALKGAPIQAGTKASLEASVGTSVDATVDKDAKKADSKDAKTTEATKDAGANQSAKVEVGAGVSGSAGNGGVNGGAQGKAQVPGASGAASASASAGAAAPTSSAAPKTGQNRVAPTPAPAETSTQTQEAPKTTVTTPAPEATETAPTTSIAPTCTPAQIQAKTCPTTAGQ